MSFDLRVAKMVRLGERARLELIAEGFNLFNRFNEAVPLFRRAFTQDPNWRELVPRLPKAGALPDDAALIKRIVEIK